MTAPWTSGPCLAIDTETTGVDPFNARIMSVAAVLVWPDGSATDPWETIVNPGVEIPSEAAAIHGIPTSKAEAEGVTPADALAVVANRIFEHGVNLPLVGFNMRFDWTLLLVEADRHGCEFPAIAPMLDPYLLDRMLERYRKGSRKLVAVSDHYGVALSDAEAHGALADATAAGRLLWRMLDRYPTLGEMSLASLFLKQVRGFDDDRDRFEDWLRRNRDPGATVTRGWPIAHGPEAS